MRMATPQGGWIAWCEYGAADGRPVLYCHGLPGSRLEHAHAAGLARQRGQRIVVPDRPGYGASTRRPNRAIADFAADAAALLDHLGHDRFDVVGFSGGGPYALACAAHMPQRVQRLALVSSWAPFDQAGTEGMAEGFRQLWELGAADFPAFSEALAGAMDAAGGAYAMLLGGAPPVDRAVFADAERAAAYRANIGEGVRPGLDGVLDDARAILSDWGVDFARIEAPARLWHGTEDPNAPIGMGRWLARRLNDAALTEWDGAGHFESFRRWDEVLDFLNPP